MPDFGQAEALWEQLLDVFGVAGGGLSSLQTGKPNSI